MSLKSLSNSDLLHRFGRLVQTERKITHLVLECISEIDQRQLYAEHAYPSLYEFLIKDFGYSPSAALRRIAAARLLAEIPQVAEKIEKGSINLSQLSQLQQAVRHIKTSESRIIPVSEKIALLEKIENTTQQQTETILNQELGLQPIPQAKKTHHRDESITFTFTLSKQELEILEKAQSLVSHAITSNEPSRLLLYLAEREIARRMQSTKSHPNSVAPRLRNAATDSQVSSTVKQSANYMNTATAKKRRSIPAALKRDLLSQYDGCQFRNSVTEKVCGSNRFLQIDHIVPVRHGGRNEISNLQILCSQHNRYKYTQEILAQPLRR